MKQAALSASFLIIIAVTLYLRSQFVLTDPIAVPIVAVCVVGFAASTIWTAIARSKRRNHGSTSQQHS